MKMQNPHKPRPRCLILHDMNPTRLIMWVAMATAVWLSSGCASTSPAVPQNVSSGAAPQQTYIQPKPLTPEELKQKEAAKREAEIAAAKRAAARDPMNWRVFNELGTVYYKQGMYDQAIAAFQQALAMHPITTVIEAEKKRQEALDTRHAAMEAQRQAAIQQAKDQESKQQMNDLFGLIGGIASMKGNVNAEMAINTMANINQQLDSTPAEVPPVAPAAKLESSLKDKREIASIYANLGMAYFEKKSYPQSIAAFDNVMQLDPSRVEVLKFSADAQYHLCEYEKCITTLTRYHAIAPVESSTLLLLSDAYQALGMAPEANKAFAAFIARHKLTSKDPVILARVGALSFSHYRYTEAAEYLAGAEHAAHNPAEGAGRLDHFLLNQYHSTNALTILLASAEFCLSHPADSIQLLKPLTEATSDPEAWYMLGRCYDELGETGAATDAYKKALNAYGAASPLDSADYYIQLCRAATGAGDEAIEVLQNKLAGVPLTPGGGVSQWCYLGLAYEKAGRIPEAMEILNRCYDANPKYAPARLALERLGKQVTNDRAAALQQADEAEKSGDQNKAIEKLADAYRLTVSGPKKEDIRKQILTLAAGMNPAPSLTSEAQDHYLRGNAALKAAQNPMDLGRSLSEFQWAIFYSPWVGDLYFNTSAVEKLENQTAGAVSNLKIYLAANPHAKNVGELLNRLYEFDYQREQKLRELAAGANF